MTSTPQELFERWFATLEQEQIPYVILHSYQEFPAHIPSDVDYAVAPECLAVVPALEQKVAAACGWVVAQRLQHELCASSTILLNPQRPAEKLMLDVTTHYVRNRSRFIDAARLLANRRRYKNFFVPAPAAEFAYLWAKTLAKGKPPAAQIPRLRELHAEDPGGCAAAFIELCGAAAGGPADWFARADSDWAKLSAATARRRRYSSREYWQDWMRSGRRILSPTGFTIAFLGPDGAGKSTVIHQVEQWLGPAFRRTLPIHFNPKFSSQSGTPVNNPQGQKPRGTLAGWGKVLFYFGRHWAHWGVRQWPARVRSTLIIYDRHFEDQLVDPRRYRLQNAVWLVRWLWRWLPAPDVTVVLDAPGELIHARKPELPGVEIERQRAVLRALAHKSKHMVVVSAAPPAAQVAAEAFRQIVARLAQRSACRERPRR